MTKAAYRIVFMGTPEFAVPSLSALIESGEEIAAVVCQPDKPRGRGRKPSPPPVKLLAQEKGIPVLQPTSIRTGDFLETIRAIGPDLIVVAAYGKILPGELLRLPPLGTINVHGSLLPKYRGAAPIQWAVINCEHETGITIMQMDEGMDTGDILLTGRLPIDPDDTSGTLSKKMAVLGGNLLVEALSRLKKNELTPTPQDDAQATMAPPLTKEMGRIDWTMDAVKLDCLIRGLDPWPCASSFIKGTYVKLFAPRPLIREHNAPAGTILNADEEGVLVACGTNALLIRELQRQGGRRLAAGDFLRGFPLAFGDRFGS